MTYTSIERVRTALEHREPDRVPLDLGGTLVSAINVHALRRLRRYLGLPDKVAVWEKVTQIGAMDDDLIERLGVDIKNVGPRPPGNPGLAKDLGVEEGHAALTDEFGIGWHMPLQGGHYYDLYKHPLSHVESVEEIENYPWPDPLDPGRFEGLKQRADRIAGEEKKAYVLERMSSGMWENATWMTGYEKFFCDMILNPKLIQAIMEKFLEIKMKFWGKALETVGENVLIVPDADDLGAQTSLLVSLELYKKIIWPYHRRLIEFIKKKAASKVYVFFHCDGAIREAIPLLIEAGIDILNPLQVNCRGMGDTLALKKEFGRDLTFWGGSCDTQFILPFGSVDQVREETKRRIADLAPGGGFIFAPIHVIQAEVPPENIMAWWETLQTFGVY
jgi:uroporphyrinogen decarboxylase